MPIAAQTNGELRWQSKHFGCWAAMPPFYSSHFGDALHYHVAKMMTWQPGTMKMCRQSRIALVMASLLGLFARDRGTSADACDFCLGGGGDRALVPGDSGDGFHLGFPDRRFSARLTFLILWKRSWFVGVLVSWRLLFGMWRRRCLNRRIALVASARSG